jgi:hypothetical protein
MKPTPCIVSVADHTGWAHFVCVAAPATVPEVIERRRVTLIDAGLPTQPYEHDTVAIPEDEANDFIARVSRSVAACSKRALERLVGELAPRCTVVAITIRMPPFPSIPKSVAAVHASNRLRNSADGMMYQQAICQAAKRLKLDVQLCKRGEEISRAAEQLGVTEGELEDFVSRSGRPPGPPWTEEHRRAFAAGIAALAPQLSRRLSLAPRRQTAD